MVVLVVVVVVVMVEVQVHLQRLELTFEIRRFSLFGGSANYACHNFKLVTKTPQNCSNNSTVYIDV